MLTTLQVNAILKECGLEHTYITEIVPNTVWRAGLTEGSDCTYDTLSKVAERLGTTDLRMGWHDVTLCTEVTFDGADAWLEIRDAKAVG